MKDKWKVQRSWFEDWYKEQFPNKETLLEKNGSYEYLDMNINMMFIGFCAAWKIVEKFDC